MEGLDEIRGYFFGALLGDGHIRYNEKVLQRKIETGGKDGPALMMKVTDRDFVQRWADCIEAMTGKKRAISVMKMDNPKHRTQYYYRCMDGDLVLESEILTRHKTIIPGEVTKTYTDAGRKAFVTGLMDAEGWLNIHLSSLKPCDLTLGFGCNDGWFPQFVEIVQSLGVKTSKTYYRKLPNKKNGDEGNTLQIIRLDIQDYVNAGLGFTIQRKADRLAFASRILNDYTRDYPRYADYFAVDDIV